MSEKEKRLDRRTGTFPVQNSSDASAAFNEQLCRMRLATGAKTQAGLARFLGIRTSDIACAGRGGKLPADWLLALVLARNINPEWVLTGRGRRFLDARTESYDDDATAAVALKNACGRIVAAVCACRNGGAHGMKD